MHVLFPRQGEARAWEASGYLRRDGFQFHWFRDGATTFDEYLARFSSKRRNQIKRELRGVREAGIVVETLAPEGHTREVARTMHALYASTIDKHGVWGRLYLNERFFETLVERFRDRLAWVVARDVASGRIVAGAFNVVGGATPLRPVLGDAHGGTVPALRRLLLRGDCALRRARHRRLRAGRGRGAQATARLRAHADAFGALARRRAPSRRARPLARARASARAGNRRVRRRRVAR